MFANATVLVPEDRPRLLESIHVARVKMRTLRFARRILRLEMYYSAHGYKWLTDRLGLTSPSSAKARENLVVGVIKLVRLASSKEAILPDLRLWLRM
jgi:hypothetical protein